MPLKFSASKVRAVATLVNYQDSLQEMLKWVQAGLVMWPDMTLYKSSLLESGLCWFRQRNCQHERTDCAYCHSRQTWVASFVSHCIHPFTLDDQYLQAGIVSGQLVLLQEWMMNYEGYQFNACLKSILWWIVQIAMLEKLKQQKYSVHGLCGM